MAVSISVAALAQLRPVFPKVKKDFKVLRSTAVKGDETIGTKPGYTTAFTKSVMDDPSTMVTRYDLQTNSSNQTRMYYYPDGTMAATANWSKTDTYGDRGTGYNYFNGTAWGAQPTARIENSKAGWPSYARWGANGEVVVSHHNSLGLIVSTRPVKGTGAWTQTILGGPAGAEDISWPRVVTNGPNNTYIHIICVTYVTYQGLTNALLYYRSLDGGATWETQHRIIDGTTSADYLTFAADTYTFAEPKGNTLAFVVGDSWTDQFLMKSTDNGTNWTKTIIWPCPYNKWAGPDTTGTFWSPDGASAIVLDNSGKAHITFGLQRASGDATGAKFWVPFTDGLVYWNEDMPEMPFDINPDTLYAHGNYIGWVQDTNVFYAGTGELAHYYVSMSSFPTMVIDDQNQMFVVWSSVTNYRDLNNFMLRHIYARASSDLGQSWHDTIADLTTGLVYNFTECVYPSASPTSSNSKIYLVFQGDPEAGVYLKGSSGAQGQQDITNNDIIFLSPSKDQIIIVGNQEKTMQPTFYVSQNSPNPFHGMTTVNVKLERPAALSMEVFNVSGQKVMDISKGTMPAGAYQFVVDGSSLMAGVYFYTVKANNEAVTKKMIVQ